MPAFDSPRVYFQDQDYTIPSAEAEFDGVFRDLSLSSEVEGLLTRWSSPVPVRALALLFTAASLNTRSCVISFAQTVLGFVNLVSSVILRRCQVDLSDHRFPPLVLAALRVRTHTVFGALPVPRRRVISSDASNFLRAQAARAALPQRAPAGVTLCRNTQPARARVCRCFSLLSLFPLLCARQLEASSD